MAVADVIERLRQQAQERFYDSVQSQRKKDYYLGYDDALDDVAKMLAERDAVKNTPPDHAPIDTLLSDGFSPTSPRGVWPETAHG